MKRLVVTLFSQLITGTALAQAPDTDLTINSLSYSGSGCPEGSIASNISPDNQALTFLFDSYVVDSSESTNGIASKNCQLKIKLNAPAGWRFALFGIDYRGFIDLSEGAKGNQTYAARFGNGPLKNLANNNFTDPISEDYQNHSEVALAYAPWSSCGNGYGEHELTIDTSASTDLRPEPTIKNFRLDSTRRRTVKLDLGRSIKKLEVVKAYNRLCKPGFSYGYQGTVAWVSRDCRADFKATLEGDQPEVPPSGTMTVDTIDGSLTQEYGIAWERCPIGPETKNISLASVRYRYAEKIMHKNITKMELVRKTSAAACRLGRSFGFSNKKAWVNLGCAGEFKLTFAD